MAKDGLGSVIDRAEAHRSWYAKFYASVAPMMQEPRQQWRRRVRQSLKKGRIMPTEGVNRAQVSVRLIERLHGSRMGIAARGGSAMKFMGLKSVRAAR